MRHKKEGFQLNRPTAHRRALLRNLCRSLVRHERIETTHTKAKALKAFADSLFAKARSSDTAAQRAVFAELGDKKVVKKFFEVVLPRYDERTGGFVRIIPRGYRKGDGAPVSYVELCEMGEDFAKPRVIKLKKKITK
ncbi:MAG TPA: 50S ribosomal protein L17 [bacterium]|nr:50S ribosomal protein L17 [bacterium]